MARLASLASPLLPGLLPEPRDGVGGRPRPRYALHPAAPRPLTRPPGVSGGRGGAKRLGGPAPGEERGETEPRVDGFPSQQPPTGAGATWGAGVRRAEGEGSANQSAGRRERPGAASHGDRMLHPGPAGRERRGEIDASEPAPP